MTVYLSLSPLPAESMRRGGVMIDSPATCLHSKGLQVAGKSCTRTFPPKMARKTVASYLRTIHNPTHGNFKESLFRSSTVFTKLARVYISHGFMLMLVRALQPTLLDKIVVSYNVKRACPDQPVRIGSSASLFDTRLASTRYCCAVNIICSRF